MQRFTCPTCGNEVFFDSLQCVVCDTELAFEVAGDGTLTIGDAAVIGSCLMRDSWRCNWHPRANGICASCLIVDAGDHANNTKLVPFLVAQRRALAQLSVLGIDWSGRQSDQAHHCCSPTARRMPATRPTIGHLDGLITLDLDEADPVQREHIRATLGEQYRTPLGHLRHELGHYVWQRYVANDPDRLKEFRDVFGDETVDYRHALDTHYAAGERRKLEGGPRVVLRRRPSMGGLRRVVGPGHACPRRRVHRARPGASSTRRAASFDPEQWMSTAVLATLAANELARAMGMRDLYPFALSPAARRKIEVAWRLTRPAGSA